MPITEFIDTRTGEYVPYNMLEFTPAKNLLYNGQHLLEILRIRSRIWKLQKDPSLCHIRSGYWNRSETAFTFVVEISTPDRDPRKTREVICVVSHSGYDWLTSRWIYYVPKPTVNTYWLNFEEE